MRLISPIARIRIGTDQYLTGDGYIKDVSVTTSENKRSNNCKFTLIDPDSSIAEKYFAMSFRQGGIDTPDDLLADEKDATIDQPPGSSQGSTADHSLTPELRAWLDTIAWSEGAEYNILLGGATFQGYDKHPTDFDAAGRYQIQRPTWDDINKRTPLPDFSPASQDKAAIDLISNRGALDSAKQGVSGIHATLEKISYEWASLPPSRYNQTLHDEAEVTQYYKQMYAKYSRGGTQELPQKLTIAKKAEVEEISNKGTEIVIELGYNINQLVAFHYIHIGTDAKTIKDKQISFQGQSVRWLLTRRTKNTTYSNITTKELAEIVAKNYGLTLEMDGDGVTYTHLDQTGITDYELLLRECRAIGYTIQDDKTKLIIKPYRPDFTGFVITQDMVIDISFSDRASKDRDSSDTVADTAQPSGEAKTTIDRVSGVVTQTQAETLKGSGKATAAAITGNNAPSVRGTIEAVSLLGSSAQDFAITPGGVLTRGGLIEAIQTDVNISGDAKTGLPNQPISTVDLSDGQADAVAIKDESRRVKGYESNATLIATPESLTLVPGAIIGVSANIAPSSLAKEWRIESVTHTIQGGSFTTSLTFYTPQKQKAEKTDTPGNKPDMKGETTSEGWGNPMSVDGNSSASDITEFGYARGRLHSGLDFGGYGSGSDPDGVFAASDGVVTRANTVLGGFGGYGRCVDITRGDKWLSRYAHLASVDVSEGQTVRQGQRIGTRGGSGYSDGAYAIHLHFEIRNPDGTPLDPRNFLPMPQIPKLG